MSIGELAALGEFIGGIGVVAGLVFVGVQIRVSNAESRAAANQAYAQSLANLGLLLASEGDLAELFLKGQGGLENLDGTERLRFMSFYSNGIFRMFENLYSQRRSGRLDERIWAGAEMTLRQVIGSRGFQEIWPLRKSWYEKDFQEYIDGLLEHNEQAGVLQRSYEQSDA